MRIVWTHHGRLRALERGVPLLHWLPDEARLTNEFVNPVAGTPWREAHQMLVREYQFPFPRASGECGMLKLVVASEMGEPASGVVVTALFDEVIARHSLRYASRPRRCHARGPKDKRSRYD